ncbi:MAG: response regulator [Myxococcota bacterium]
MNAPQIDRILLIDDDDVTAFLVQRLVQKSGMVGTLHRASDGLEGLEMLNAAARGEAEKPDVILLDINMPRMTGIEFLAAYEQLPETTRSGVVIVMFTTSLLERDRRTAEASPHVQGFFNKPLSREQLTELAALTQYAS